MRQHKRFTVFEIERILEAVDQNGKPIRARDLMPDLRSLGSLYKKRRQLMKGQIPSIQLIDERVLSEMPRDEEVELFRNDGTFNGEEYDIKHRLLERICYLRRYPYTPKTLAKIVLLHNTYGLSLLEMWKQLRDEGCCTCRKRLKQEIEFLQSL